MSTIKVNQDARIMRVISTRESDFRTGITIAATRDTNLATTKIELRTSDVGCSMEGDLFHAEEIVSIREGGGKIDEDFGLTFTVLEVKTRARNRETGNRDENETYHQ